MRKKIIRWFVGIILAPIALFFIVAVLLYIPPIQDFAVNKTTAILSENTGMEVRIGRLRLAFLLDIDLQNVEINDSTGENLLTVERLIIDLSYPKLLHGEVDVEGIELNNARVNTKDLIDGLKLKGKIGRLFADSHGIELTASEAVINNIQLNDTDLEIELKTTQEEEDTESTTPDWTININSVLLTDVHLTLGMPTDSMTVETNISSATMQQGIINLANGIYNIRHFDLTADSLRYDIPYKEQTTGLDANHIALNNINIGIDSILFDMNATAIDLILSQFQLKEKSGIEVSSITGHINMDSTSVSIPDLELTTPDSYATLQAYADLASLEGATGTLWARLSADLGKQDIMLFVGDMPQEFIISYPNKPITVRLAADGNMGQLNLSTADISLPGAFQLTANGTAQNLTDSLNMSADIKFAMQTADIDFVKALSQGALDSIALPPLILDGRASMNGQNYNADISLKEGNGSITLSAQADLNKTTYAANLNIDSLNLRDFMPKDSVGIIAATAQLNGKGTDPLNKNTTLTAELEIHNVDYDIYNIQGLSLEAQWKQSSGYATIQSHNNLLEMTSIIKASATKELVDAALDINIEQADLQKLNVSQKQCNIGVDIHLDAQTDMEETHQAHGSINNITIISADSTFHPKDMAFNALTRTDTLHADFTAGDFNLTFNAHEGLTSITEKITSFTTLAQEQIQNYYLDYNTLKTVMPDASLNLHIGKENPIINYLTISGYSFNEADLAIDAGPQIGIQGNGHIHSLKSGDVLIDTIGIKLFQDTTGLAMQTRVQNGPTNKQFVFDARLNAYLHPDGAGVDLIYLDDKNIPGVNIGLKANINENGLRLVFPQTNPIVAYRNFKINKDNYISLDTDYKLEANVTMRADDGTAIRIYSTPNDIALEDVTLELQNINLKELTSVIPYAPHVSGMLQAEAHIILTETKKILEQAALYGREQPHDTPHDQTKENTQKDQKNQTHPEDSIHHPARDRKMTPPPPLSLAVAAEISVDSLNYEGAELGKTGLDLVYLPRSEKDHFVDVRLLHQETEVGMLLGAYHADNQSGQIKADLLLKQLPLSLANGFIPDQMATLQGTANGIMTVEGPLDAPDINGWFATNNTKIKSAPYSLDLSLEDDTVTVNHSHLDLDKLNIYSTGKNPLTFDGTINFADFENITLDLQVKANDFELINAKKTQQATLYGKVYVNVGMRINGDLNNLNVGGQLTLSGATDVTYILKDSPLTVEDRLADLVVFTDFNDTLTVDNDTPTQPMNINMMFRLNIDEAAQIHCLLSADKSSYIDLEGGGELTMTYTPQGEITLTGRYTVNSGEMKYSLPVIPLKTFTITNGSYIDFNGPILNPTLNIAATETTRATVTENDSPRSVTFNVGLSITQTLENMGLEFTIEAPEDLTIQNQIASMSTEERGKTAVTLLATGMYIGTTNQESGFSTSNALNALLQSEISNIAGKALQTIDLSVGIDQQTTAEGTDRTDYSFRFSKRLWGNRVSIIVGGKVSTGENVENTGESIIDNISLEYRLDKNATRYVTLFYDRNYESLLEGEITEMGAGLVLRRKMSKISELFIFKNKKKEQKTDNEK